MDVVVHTRLAELAMPVELIVLAVERWTEREQSIQLFEDASHRAGAGIWPEVARAVFGCLASGEDARPGILERDLDKRVAFVVLEQNIVLRTVLLDHIHLKQQRLQLR